MKGEPEKYKLILVINLTYLYKLEQLLRLPFMLLDGCDANKEPLSFGRTTSRYRESIAITDPFAIPPPVFNGTVVTVSH